MTSVRGCRKAAFDWRCWRMREFEREARVIEVAIKTPLRFNACFARAFRALISRRIALIRVVSEVTACNV